MVVQTFQTPSYHTIPNEVSMRLNPTQGGVYKDESKITSIDDWAKHQ